MNDVVEADCCKICKYRDAATPSASCRSCVDKWERERIGVMKEIAGEFEPEMLSAEQMCRKTIEVVKQRDEEQRKRGAIEAQQIYERIVKTMELGRFRLLVSDISPDAMVFLRHKGYHIEATSNDVINQQCISWGPEKKVHRR